MNYNPFLINFFNRKLSFASQLFWMANSFLSLFIFNRKLFLASQLFWVPNFFWTQILTQPLFWTKNFFGTRVFFSQKLVWTQNDFGPENSFWPNLFFDSNFDTQFTLDTKFYWHKGSWNNTFLGHLFSGQNIFGHKIFLY